MARSRHLAAAFAAGLAALPLAACSHPAACPAISLASVVTIHVAEHRAATLDHASLTGEACQDGACYGGPLELRAEGGDSTQATPVPSYVAMIQMTKPLTENPIDLTVSGKDTSGASIGDPHLRFSPRIDYPWGPQCPRVVIAETTFDDAGLHAR
ncbi:hypothetical protein SPF06_08705 [Sinomonas sp. JGH33]|uniref:Lipoprotein n=1 Tax=Sinomonas terricola TaxID=3110330 RepID=A0ABU5T5L0_9MICC|nr:hypothetical protein [Sinomonas sp. JGH33]MEA5454799.1 hypothetical protein [Sinomonas sp. JGH33]